MIRKLLIGSVVLASGVVIGVAGNRAVGQQEFYGSFDCNACQLKSPGPEPGTVAYLEYMSNWLSSTKARYTPMAGDQFMVCNAGYCVVYTRNSQNFTGGQPMARKAPGDQGGGGGGGGAGVAIVAAADGAIREAGTAGVVEVGAVEAVEAVA